MFLREGFDGTCLVVAGCCWLWSETDYRSSQNLLLYIRALCCTLRIIFLIGVVVVSSTGFLFSILCGKFTSSIECISAQYHLRVHPYTWAPRSKLANKSWISTKETVHVIYDCPKLQLWVGIVIKSIILHWLFCKDEVFVICQRVH